MFKTAVISLYAHADSFNYVKHNLMKKCVLNASCSNAEAVHLLCPPCIHTPYGNPVIAVIKSVDHYDQPTGQRITHSDTVYCSYWNVREPHHAGSTSIIIVSKRASSSFCNSLAQMMFNEWHAWLYCFLAKMLLVHWLACKYVHTCYMSNTSL